MFLPTGVQMQGLNPRGRHTLPPRLCSLGHLQPRWVAWGVVPVQSRAWPMPFRVLDQRLKVMVEGLDVPGMVDGRMIFPWNYDG